MLVHTFFNDPEGEFEATAESGLAQAETALERAEAALGELAYRRRGLAFSLVAILLVLVGLGLKIRQLSDRQEG